MSALQSSLASRPAIIADLFRPNVRRSPKSTTPDSRQRKLHRPNPKFTSPARRDDWHLIRQAAVGNHEAQERLFKTHTPRLYRTAFAVLRNKEDAEDVVQDSWCRAYANLNSFEGRSAFSTWLTRIAINSALMLRRRKSYRIESSLHDVLDHQSESLLDRTVATSPNPEEVYAATELHALVENQISKLPPRVQAALRLQKIEELSITETAGALGIRETAVKSRVLRAHRKIATGLRKLLLTPPHPHALVTPVCKEG